MTHNESRMESFRYALADYGVHYARGLLAAVDPESASHAAAAEALFSELCTYYAEALQLDEAHEALIAWAESIADERVRLLQKKYVDGITSDEQLRLEFCTHVLDAAWPPVSLADWKALNDIARDHNI